MWRDGTYFKDNWRPKVGRQRLVTSRSLVHFYCTVVVNAFCPRYLARISAEHGQIRSERELTVSHSNKLFCLSLRYLSNRGHMSGQVPTTVIASSNRLATVGSSIFPSAMAVFLSTSLAFSSFKEITFELRGIRFHSPRDTACPAPPVSLALALL